MTDANQISSQQSIPTAGRDECVKKMLQSAKDAVDRLGLTDFIKDNKAAIYRQLEDFTHVTKGPIGLDPNAAFVAQTLPLASGVIHVGSSRTNFDKAALWVQNQSAHAQPNSVLPTLVLLYIVHQGWQDARDTHDEKKKAQWESIYERAKWLCEKPEIAC
jgi:hypothetical protein